MRTHRVIAPLLSLLMGMAAASGTAQQATAAAEAGPRPLPAVLADYVRTALAGNLALRASGLEVERSVAALNEARARFLPTLDLEARYTRARGGREIDIPVGTLVNPVYATLNQLLAAQGRPAPFGTVGNQTILFQREREQDTRIALRQPLWAPAIPAALRAQRALLEATEFARTALARRVQRDVSVAYLEWLRADRTVGIVASSQTLLEENLRVTDSLYRNGKVTEDQVLRAKAELLSVEQQSTEARHARSQAQSYLNFLLNRDLDTALEPCASEDTVARAGHELGALRSAALANRPELVQLERAARAAGAQVQLAHAGHLPTLSLGVDAGTQDERYDFGRGRNFGAVSLQLNWRFFDGGAARAAEHAARAEQRRLQTEREQTSQQIQLEVQQALERLESSADSLAAAAARAEAARAALRIASRKRDEGVISQVEFIDARSSLTSAELNLNATRIELLERQADLDYSTAAGPLPLPTGT